MEVDREVDRQRYFSLVFFFDMLDAWAIVKLTGLCGWCVVLGCSCGLCWRSGGGLGTSVGHLGPLSGPVGGRLGPPSRPLWAVLGGYQAGNWTKPKREQDRVRTV